jgi:hypothetical protein
MDDSNFETVKELAEQFPKHMITCIWEKDSSNPEQGGEHLLSQQILRMPCLLVFAPSKLHVTHQRSFILANRRRLIMNLKSEAVRLQFRAARSVHQSVGLTLRMNAKNRLA